MASWSLQDIRVDGTSIKTPAIGARLRTLDGIPPKRGENARVAFRRGRRWRPKSLDQVERTLEVWVDCKNEMGAEPLTTDLKIAQLNYNLNMLFAAIYKESAQVEVVRDLLYPDGSGGVETITLTAYGECVEGFTMQADENDQTYMQASIPMVFADPIWYESVGVESILGNPAP